MAMLEIDGLHIRMRAASGLRGDGWAPPDEWLDPDPEGRVLMPWLTLRVRADARGIYAAWLGDHQVRIEDCTVRRNSVEVWARTEHPHAEGVLLAEWRAWGGGVNVRYPVGGSVAIDCPRVLLAAFTVAATVPA